MAWQSDSGGWRRTLSSIQIGYLALVSTLSWSTSLRAATIPEIVAKAKQAVVQITTFDQNRQPLKTGTGFFVTGDGYLLSKRPVNPILNLGERRPEIGAWKMNQSQECGYGVVEKR